MNHFDTLIQEDNYHWQQLQPHLDQLATGEQAGFITSLEKLALGSNYVIAQ